MINAKGKKRYNLKRANYADYDFLYRLKVSCLKEYVATTWGWDEEFQRNHFQEHFDPAKIQIIVVDGQDVGELSVRDGGSEVFLDGIYIMPDYQRRGLGTTIINDVLERARSSKKPLNLQVLKVNPARRLYERLGFKVVDENESHFLMLAR